MGRWKAPVVRAFHWSVSAGRLGGSGPVGNRPARAWIPEHVDHRIGASADSEPPTEVFRVRLRVVALIGVLTMASAASDGIAR